MVDGKNQDKVLRKSLKNYGVSPSLTRTYCCTHYTHNCEILHSLSKTLLTVFFDRRHVVLWPFFFFLSCIRQPFSSCGGRRRGGEERKKEKAIPQGHKRQAKAEKQGDRNGAFPLAYF